MSCVVTREEHDLVKIASKPYQVTDAVEVVRWCRDCGAVVIDVDYDGRTSPGAIMPMRFPQLALNQAQKILRDAA